MAPPLPRGPAPRPEACLAQPDLTTATALGQSKRAPLRSPAPAAVRIRPDGHVAWVGDGRDAGLADALGTWFGLAA